MDNSGLIKYNVTDRLPPLPLWQSKLASCASKKSSTAALHWLRLAATWDRGSRSVREKILAEFIKGNRGKTGPQLERDFGNGASLFLTRLTAYLRLVYLLCADISLHLEAIDIFISASSGLRFLAEFLEIGGILTLLEILALPQIKNSNKALVLRMLIHIAEGGRKYKEFICESFGIRAVSECLMKSSAELVQDHARNLLYQLGQGNSKFLIHVYKALLTIITTNYACPTSQQMAGQAFRLLLPSIQNLNPSVVSATMGLLRNIHLQVQYEGYEILRELAHRPSLQDIIIENMVELLRFAEDVSDEEVEVKVRRRRRSSIMEGIESMANASNNPDKVYAENITSTYVQQSYAAKILGAMAATSTHLCNKIIQKQVVGALLCTIANKHYVDSQKYAANTLIFLAEKYANVREGLIEYLGESFLEALQTKPDTFYLDLTKDQIKYLQRNQLHIRISSADEPINAESLNKTNEFSGGLEGADDTELDDTFTGEDEDEINPFNNELMKNSMKSNVVDSTNGNTALRRSSIAEENSTASKDENNNGAGKQKEALDGVDATTAPQFFTIDSVYLPQTIVNISNILTGSKFSNESEDPDEKFLQNLEKMKILYPSKKLNGTERKVEVEVKLDASLSERVAKAISKDQFKVFLPTIPTATITSSAEKSRPDSADRTPNTSRPPTPQESTDQQSGTQEPATATENLQTVDSEL